MSVIERSLTVYECPRCGLRKLDSGDMVIHSRDCGGEFEPVEYVPSTTTQGAVKDARALASFVRFLLGAVEPPSSVREALSHHPEGGQ